MKNTLVSKWNKGDYYTIEAHNGETIIAGSGKAGLKRAVEHVAKKPKAYSHIRNEFGNTFRVLELDGTIRPNSPVYSH